MRRVVLIAVAVPMLLSPALAAAAKKEPVEQPSGPVAAAQTTVKVNGIGGTPGTATATCPKGTQVLSGGWNTTGATRTGFLTVYESVRAGKRAWRIRAIINGTPTPPATQIKLSLTAYAYCRAGTALRQRAKTATLTLIQNDYNAATVTAACPKQTSAVSGGFRIPVPTTTTAGWVHQSSRQSSRSWSVTATAITNVSLPSIPVTAIAYCAPGAAPASRKTTVQAPPSDTPPGTFTPGGVPRVANSPKCANMVAGGFRSPSVIATPAASAIPWVFESRRVGKNGPWRTSMFNPGVDTTTLTSVGYCG